MTKTVKPMLITEVITRHYEPVWCRRDFIVMSPEFKKIREGLSKSFNRCFGCDRPFQIGATPEEGEIMHIVHFNGKGNELVCTDCLNKLFGEKAKLEYWKKEDE